MGIISYYFNLLKFFNFYSLKMSQFINYFVYSYFRPFLKQRKIPDLINQQFFSVSKFKNYLIQKDCYSFVMLDY